MPDRQLHGGRRLRAPRPARPQRLRRADGRAREAQTTEYTTAPLGAALRAVPVRVWAELGRARMPAGTSLDLPTGSVVELDREVEDPVDLYVDGLHFATGRLRVAEDGSLQLEVEQVLGLQHGAGAVAELEAPPAPALADEPAMADPEMAEPEPEVAEAVTLEAEEVPQAEPDPQQKARRCDMARVLVVDDAAFMRKMVSDVLLGGGHEVVGEAGDGVEAVAALPGAASRGDHARHHDAREGRPLGPARDHRSWTRPPAS